MNYETNRLNTFANWPSSAPVDPIRIAKAGFYYTGSGTEVQCFSCGGKISQWNYGDQVMWRHRQLDPNCPFVVNPQISANVPLVLDTGSPSIAESASSRVALPEGRIDSLDVAQEIGPTEEDEMYRNDALRLLSYANWDDTSVSRESLASAGFYHAGEGRLRCAWCGGELAPFRRFGSLGQPLDVHRMYFPRCEHAASLEASQRSATVSLPPSQRLDAPRVPTPPQPSENQLQSSGAEVNERVLDMGGTWRAKSVVSGGARHPQYTSLAARLASYEHWPANRLQVPKTLAEAGFYYTGIDDQVRCFYCDGGLGKWEVGDTPWSEHAHWFPHCGYVLLVKGQEYIESCKNRTTVHRTVSAESGLNIRRRIPVASFPVTDSQVEQCMASSITRTALDAGLDADDIRRVIAHKLRISGLPFSSSGALIDAVLDEPLSEAYLTSPSREVSPTRPRLARDILAETLRDFAPQSGIIPMGHWEDRPDSARFQSGTTRSLSPFSVPDRRPTTDETPVQECEIEATSRPEEKKLTLEEENRQLKEARLCKVCMDCEASVVFLPCGHLLSCAMCAMALPSCPLCRASVRAMVRAYLA